MWYFILNKIWKPKKLNINKLLKPNKWEKNKIKKIIDMRVLSTLLDNYKSSEKKTKWVSRLTQLYKKFIFLSKSNARKKYNNYSTIVILKLTKKQLLSTVMKLNKVIAFKSNGIFLKKLNIAEKSKKKDIKLYITNLKKTEETLRKLNLKQLLINLVYCNAILFRVNKAIKTIFKKYDYNLIFSPKIPFSFKKFKKVKAIKRKLRKIYTVL
jgi:hypothetical protein